MLIKETSWVDGSTVRIWNTSPFKKPHMDILFIMHKIESVNSKRDRSNSNKLCRGTIMSS